VNGNITVSAQWSGGGALQEGVYIGLISFAGTATDLTGGSPIFLDYSGKENLISKLTSDYNIASQSGTALFYGVHQAFANLTEWGTYPSKLDSVNVITFTDGLDNSSTGQSAATPIESRTFDREDEYAAYVQGEITYRVIGDKSITAYSVGVRGDDVTDPAKFTSTLESIASTGKSTVLDNFGALENTFEDIADSLQVVHTNTTFNMTTTLLPSDTKVRMTFDVTDMNPQNAESSQKYIEGTITRTGTGLGMTYSFGSIEYSNGIGSSQGAGPITGTINGSEVTFAFTGVTGYDSQTDEAKQWLMSPGSNSWQINSEYNAGGATDVQIEKRSSIIYLVLDASKSLNTTQIEQIKSAAQQFITSLYDQLGEN
jgi:hypothetical protein